MKHPGGRPRKLNPKQEKEVTLAHKQGILPYETCYKHKISERMYYRILNRIP